MEDYRVEMLDILNSEIDSKDYISLCQDNNPSAFSRSRIFTIRRLIILLMTMRTSYQIEINQFCKKIFSGDYNIKQATSGALSQARAKLNPKAFQRLNELCVDTYYKGADFKKWQGYRLLAVDGSVLNLPSSKDILSEFGCEDYVIQNSGKKSLARCSLLFDVLNQVSLDAQISSYRTSEKRLLENHLDTIQRGDLVLADRGYAYSSIVYWLKQRGIDFCIRFHDEKMNLVKDFKNSDQTDTEIEFKIDPKTAKSMGLSKDTPAMKIRLIKVVLDTGEIEILGTSLMDVNKYKPEIFKELYFLRWGVEEAFKMLKSRVGIEQFSGRTARSIYQDFYAKIFMMNLCSTLSHPIEQKLREEYSADKSGNQYSQKMNRTNAMAETSSNLIKLFSDKFHNSVLSAMDKIFYNVRTLIRPGRKFKRYKYSRRKHSTNYKRI